MSLKMSSLCILIIGIVVFFGGWRGYHYFFDTHAPTLSIQGVVCDAYYADDVHCRLEGYDDYKIADISVWLDGKLLVHKFKINAKQFEYPFTVSTKKLLNGVHTLKAEAVNGTYNGVKSTMQTSFFVDNNPLQAAFLRSDADHKVLQGRTLHIQFQVNKEIQSATARALSHSYLCFQEAKNSPIYECFIPITCEEVPNEYPISIEIVDHVGNIVVLESKFQILPFQFKKQLLRIDPSKVKEEKEAGIAAQELEVALEKLAQQSPQKKMWQGVFYPPIDIVSISTEYGTVRTTQERGRYAHKAVDVLNMPKSVVWATQDGVVVLKDRYAYSGNTIVIDHGYGILSLFFHLDSFADITVGDLIKRGNPIGTLGKTGYASGYHLHWEMRINNIPVDPMQWIKVTF